MSIKNEKEGSRMVFEKNNGFIFREILGKCVILNSETGDYFGLNAVGSSFLDLVDGKRDLDVIISELMNIYEADETTLRNDILELVSTMLLKGILTQTEQ
jgi:hypothetical protein